MLLDGEGNKDAHVGRMNRDGLVQIAQRTERTTKNKVFKEI